MENSNTVLSKTNNSNNINKSEKADNNPGNSDFEEKKFIPLAAKDSEWVDTAYHKPKSRIKPSDNEEEDDVEDEEEEEEMFLVNPANEIETENLPIYALFPSLRVHYPESSSFLNREISTTDIAKSLVGEKPNFSVLKTSAKLLPSKIVLESIQEISVDESEEDDNNIENYSNVIDNSSSKEIGDASKRSIEDQCLLHRSSKSEVQREIHRAFPMPYPPENQIKGLWYESNSDNNLIHPTERIKKNIPKTENNNPEI